MRKEERGGEERRVSSSWLLLQILSSELGKGKERGNRKRASFVAPALISTLGEAATDNRRNRTAVTGTKMTIGSRYRPQKEGS